MDDQIPLFPVLRGCLLPVLLFGGLGIWCVLQVHSRLVIEIPDLRQSHLEEALRQLQNRGFRPHLEGSPKDELPPDFLVQTTRPGPGERTWRGSRVEVVLAMGLESHRVPDLQGLTLEEARRLLEASSFTLGQSFELISPSPPGIIGQSPQAGSLARHGLIDVLLSTGAPPPVQVAPAVIGRHQMEVLGPMGWDRQQISSLLYREAPEKEGLVLEQKPAPGEPLGPAGLELVVGKAEKTQEFEVLLITIPRELQEPVLRLFREEVALWKLTVSPGEELQIALPKPETSLVVELWEREEPWARFSLEGWQILSELPEATPTSVSP